MQNKTTKQPNRQDKTTENRQQKTQNRRHKTRYNEQKNTVVNCNRIGQ